MVHWPRCQEHRQQRLKRGHLIQEHSNRQSYSHRNYLLKEHPQQQIVSQQHLRHGNQQCPRPSKSLAAHHLHQISPGFSSTPSSPPQTPIVPNSPRTGPRSITKSSWEKWIERLNSPVGWISITLALVFGIFAYNFGIKALVLQVWSAHNDQRDSCWTDRDHGIYSKACNETLAHPATPPPFKRETTLQKSILWNSDWLLLVILPALLHLSVKMIMDILPLLPEIQSRRDRYVYSECLTYALFAIFVFEVAVVGMICKALYPLLTAKESLFGLAPEVSIRLGVHLFVLLLIFRLYHERDWSQ